MRRTAVLLLMVALVPGCADRGTPGSSEPAASHAAALAASTSSTALLQLQAGVRGPKAVLRFASTGTRGSLCWSGPTGGFCADLDPRALMPNTYVDMPQGTMLQIRGDATSVSGVLAHVRRKGALPELVELQRLAFVDGMETVSLGPGKYTLQLVGSWPQGQAPFYFGIRVRH